MKPVLIVPDVEIAPAQWMEFPNVVLIGQGWLEQNMGPAQLPETHQEGP